jgi:hypothetical protein
MGFLDFTQFAGYAEIISALAVVVTLGYLAIQIRQTNRQVLLQSLQDTWASLSEFCDLLAESEEVSSIIIRGRESIQNLSEVEKLRFSHVHIRLLNTIEIWLLALEECNPRGKLRRQHMENITEIISEYFGHPGTLEFLNNFNPAFAPPELHDLIASNTDLQDIA